MFIKKYKFFSNENNYQVYGYIKKSLIVNIFTAMAKKDMFEVRALLQGDTNAQTIFYGTKEECLNYMAKFAEFYSSDQDGLLPEPSGQKTEKKD